MTTLDYDVTFQTYDEPTQGDGLVRFQWRNGERKRKSGGYFFLPARRLPEGFTPGAPWVETTEVFESGDEEPGYKAEVLKLAIIGARQQPFIKRDGVKTWLPRGKYAKGEQGAGLQVDVLCAAEGLEELGPVCWASSTVKTSFAIIARDGILHTLKDQVVKAAEAIKKAPLRPWCFWATVATERDAKGAVVYTETQGKPVTRPMLALPATIDKAALIGMATGKDWAVWGEEQRGAYDAWFKEERTNDVAPAQPAGKNVPQVIDGDADLPF